MDWKYVILICSKVADENISRLICSKSNFCNSNQVYKKMYQCLQYEINLVKPAMNIGFLILQLFSSLDVNISIFLFKFGIGQVWYRTKLKQSTFFLQKKSVYILERIEYLLRSLCYTVFMHLERTHVVTQAVYKEWTNKDQSDLRYKMETCERRLILAFSLP